MKAALKNEEDKWYVHCSQEEGGCGLRGPIRSSIQLSVAEWNVLVSYRQEWFKTRQNANLLKACRSMYLLLQNIYQKISEENTAEIINFSQEIKELLALISGENDEIK